MMRVVFNMKHLLFLQATVLLLGLSHVVKGEKPFTCHPLDVGVDGLVHALMVYEDELVAGGQFRAVDDEPINYIARWSAGRGWQSLGKGMNNFVKALTEYNGDLIAGGFFRYAGGVKANKIARWDGKKWRPLGAGMDRVVDALTVYDGELIAGGTFRSAGGVDALRIARWDGKRWHPLGEGIGTEGPFAMVAALTVYKGELIAAGSFTIADGEPADHIARWNGETWRPVGTGMNGEVYALTVYKGDLIAAGHFTMAGGVRANNIARWDGKRWHPLGRGLERGLVVDWEKDWGVLALTTYNGELIAGGGFNMAGGVEAHRIARWNGATWQPLGARVNGIVWSLTAYDGGWVTGGRISAVGALPVRNISYWRPTDSTAGSGI
jgi:hypothetical protein